MGKKMKLDQILSFDDLMVQEATIVDKPTRLAGLWERKHGKKALCKRFVKTGFFSKLRFSGVGGKEQQLLEREIISQLDCLMDAEPANGESILRAVLGLGRLCNENLSRLEGENWERCTLEIPKATFAMRLASGDLEDFFKSLPQPRQDLDLLCEPEFYL